mmetsp:Transcript_3292/g.7002  ORF Transcript_3292/g.7002 Transcript_3292/m.7002 type:complete len:218 (+) Transcript_3292:3617-4270(+)
MERCASQLCLTRSASSKSESSFVLCAACGLGIVSRSLVGRKRAMRGGNGAGVARAIKKASAASAMATSIASSGVVVPCVAASHARGRVRSSTSRAERFSAPPAVSVPPRQLATSCRQRCRASSLGSHRHGSIPTVPSSRLPSSCALFCTDSGSAQLRLSRSAGTSCACGIHEVLELDCWCGGPSPPFGSPPQSTVSICSTASEPRWRSSSGSSFERL